MPDDTSSSIAGVWRIVRAELGGQPMPPDAAAQVELEFTASNYTVRFGGEDTDHGTYTITASPELHQIAMTGKVGVNVGKTIPGILQVTGDRMRICYALEGTAAPTQFEAPAGTLCYLATYRRKAPTL